MKSKKALPEAETTLRFYLPKDLAVKAWNMAAEEGLSFNDYVLKLLLEDVDRLAEDDRLKRSGRRRS